MSAWESINMECFMWLSLYKCRCVYQYID